MKRLIQYYTDDNHFRVFANTHGVLYNKAVADIHSTKMIGVVSAKRVLKSLGYKFTKTEKTEWGFEVEVEC